MKRALAMLAALAALLPGQKPENDPILKAMREEMARARELKLPGVEDQLYYV